MITPGSTPLPGTTPAAASLNATVGAPASVPAGALGAPAGVLAAVAAPAGYAILYVDDEEQALKYFKKAFKHTYPVLTATGVDAAIAILEVEHSRIGILLTDHRMPGKTGVELLTRVRKQWPHIMRVMVTAYADMESAVEAVNAGAVFKYLSKPVDIELTKQVLAEAMKAFTDAHDREAALADKGSLIERMMVADRVSSLATMANGISHHIRNSLTAMNCFFEEIGEKLSAARSGKPAGADGGDAYLDELLQLANQERQRLVGMVREVETRGTRPQFRWDEQIDVAQLLSRAVADAAAPTGGAEIRVEAPAGLASLHVDGAAVVRMFCTFIVHAHRYSPPGLPIRVTADGPQPYWDGQCVRVRILTDGPEWDKKDVATFFTPFSLTTKNPSDVGMELLDAFQTALGHHGDVVAHRGPPDGPGFSVCLPVNPATVRRPVLVDGRLEVAA